VDGSWAGERGVVRLPGGAPVRGRRLAHDLPPADFALAALAVLDGLPPGEAVRWVRREYHPRAVETPWQRWWLRRVR
jgi:hypothetical protein